ncbi:MAG: hypothetical protein HQ536_02050, partial [Parcubacteria group bacterium]|nr:hypothetical protein [Parcubacteria group bacterium]
KYGEQTDFSGYFDKFFTVEIFQFKNEEIIEKATDEIISHFQVEDKKDLSKALGSHGLLRIFIKDILLKSLELDGKEKLSLRQLLKGVKYQIPILNDSNYKEDLFSGRDKIAIHFMDIGIKSLISIFSGMKTDFIIVLEKIKNNIKNKEDVMRSCDIFSYLLLKKISPFEETGNNFRRGWHGYAISITNGRIKSVARKTKPASEVSISYFYFDLLIEYVSNEHYEEHEE